MAFARARAARTLHSSFRRSVPTVSAPGRTQLVQRRWASGGGEGHAEPGSDLPWALGAVAVTVPSCWYLWPDSSHADAGHHGHGDEHGEDHAEGEDGSNEQEAQQKAEEPVEEESVDSEDFKPETAGEQQEGEKEDAEKVESESDDSKDGKEKPSSGTGEVKKDANSGTENQAQTAEVTKDDDSKPTKTEANSDEGAEEKRVQKDRTVRKPKPSSGQPLANPSPQEGDNEDEAKGSGTSMGRKQAGISNTQAKHSIPIQDSPDKSKKPEGGPDTAKASGTVAVKRHD